MPGGPRGRAGHGNGGEELVTVRFNEAHLTALSYAARLSSELTADVVVTRDLLGRNGLLVITDQDIPEDIVGEYKRDTHPFTAPVPIARPGDMFSPDLILKSRDLRRHYATEAPGSRVYVLERGVVGAGWLRAKSVNAPRVTFYGYKGGVGRSTAAFFLAEYAARQNLAVLVIDLDLECPGISTMLAPDMSDWPSHGVLDHLVEYPHGTENGLQLVSRATSIPSQSPQEGVWFTPASGSLGDYFTPSGGRGGALDIPQNYGYLDKLSRVYANVPRANSNEQILFGDRLEAAVSFAEKQFERMAGKKPDITILDSRSGMHDIAAAAISQLGGVSLLFAQDNPQTWVGYRELFSRWSQHLDADDLDALRQRIQMVSAITPDATSDTYDKYVRRFADNSQACFAATLYDPESGEMEEGAFNFSPNDEAAPHYPLIIRHASELVGVAVGTQPKAADIVMPAAHYDEFCTSVLSLLREMGFKNV